MFSAYDLLLKPGINRPTQLTVRKVFKVNSRLEMFLNLTQIKKTMHSLHNMLYFERIRHWCSIFTVFVRGNLSTQCCFPFLADFLTASFFSGKSLPIFTKGSVLDVTGVLNPPQNVPTWIACANNLIQVRSIWPLYLTFAIRYQSAKTQSIGKVVYDWPQSSDYHQ